MNILFKFISLILAMASILYSGLHILDEKSENVLKHNMGFILDGMVDQKTGNSCLPYAVQMVASAVLIVGNCFGWMWLLIPYILSVFWVWYVESEGGFQAKSLAKFSFNLFLGLCILILVGIILCGFRKISQPKPNQLEQVIVDPNDKKKLKGRK